MCVIFLLINYKVNKNITKYFHKKHMNTEKKKILANFENNQS